MFDLQSRHTAGAGVFAAGAGDETHTWHLQIPAGPAGQYRWAQLDDYLHRPRRQFLWQAPLRLELSARASAAGLPGTWGFGLWNDPFNASLGLNGMARRLPALPNTVWFFHAAPPNYLALSDHHPAAGFLAATFCAPRLPAALLAVGVPALPLLLWPPTARRLRRLGRYLVGEDAARLDLDVTAWHAYAFEWQQTEVRFFVDGALCFTTRCAPGGRLGVVVWIDNQYAAFHPEGRLQAGTLSNPAPAWLEVANLTLS